MIPVLAEAVLNISSAAEKAPDIYIINNNRSQKEGDKRA